MHRSKTEPEVLTTGHGSPQWSPDGQRLFFKRGASRVAAVSSGLGRADLWAVDRETRAEKQLTDLSGRTGFLGDSALATDGTYLYFGWNENVGDIWVMHVATEHED